MTSGPSFRIIAQRDLGAKRSRRWYWTVERRGNIDPRFDTWDFYKDGFAWTLEGARTKALTHVSDYVDTLRFEMLVSLGRPDPEPEPPAPSCPLKSELLP